MNIPTDQPVQAREHEVPDRDALNNYLKQHHGGLGEIREITQFPGGYSNLTFCLKTKDNEFILRRPPIGAAIKSAHDMGREFQVLSKLKPHYAKVPMPVVYCDDESVIGASFYIMERLQGVILRATYASKLKISPELFRQISEGLLDNLVQLHSIDCVKTELDQLGKPDGYVQRQVEGWIGRYYKAETDKLEDMDVLAGWLKPNLPSVQNAATLLHNDYKYDNVIYTPQLGEIVGVLDWEMATVGDPLMDLGACLAYWSEAGDDPVLQSFNLTALPGNLSRTEVINRYAEKSNRDVSRILFYYVFGLFKNAVIAQQIYARWKQGFSNDARFGALLVVIKALSKLGIESLNKEKI